MKKFNTILGAFALLFIVACEGPEGPPGFDGEQGEPGIQGQVFEVDGINFDFDAGANLFVAPITFSDFTNFEVIEEDALLVFRFDGTVELDDGSTADAWSQIPQSFFLPEGTLQYVFAHTFVDVELFIDGNFDLSLVDPAFTDDQLFRFVIVPSVFATSSRLDTSNLSAVMSAIGVSEDDVQKIQLN